MMSITNEAINSALARQSIASAVESANYKIHKATSTIALHIDKRQSNHAVNRENLAMTIKLNCLKWLVASFLLPMVVTRPICTSG